MCRLTATGLDTHGGGVRVCSDKYQLKYSMMEIRLYCGAALGQCSGSTGSVAAHNDYF